VREENHTISSALMATVTDMADSGFASSAVDDCFQLAQPLDDFRPREWTSEEHFLVEFGALPWGEAKN